MYGHNPLRRSWSSTLQDSDAPGSDANGNLTIPNTAKQEPISPSRCSVFEVTVRSNSNESPESLSPTPNAPAARHREVSSPQKSSKTEGRKVLNPAGGAGHWPTGPSSSPSELSARKASETSWNVNKTAQAWARSRDVAPSVTLNPPHHEIDVSSRGRVASLVEKFQAQQTEKSASAAGGRGAERGYPNVGSVGTKTSLNVRGSRVMLREPESAAVTTQSYDRLQTHLLPKKTGISVDYDARVNVSADDGKTKNEKDILRSKEMKLVKRKNVLKTEKQIVLSTKRGEKEPAVSKKESVKRLLKLDSTLSDDGYNIVAPISTPSQDLPADNAGVLSVEPAAPKEKRLSMYDWALQAQDEGSDVTHITVGGGYSADLQKSPGSQHSKTVRETPKDSVTRSLTLPPINIFVGTWNTEYGEFPVTAMLSNCNTENVNKPPAPPRIDGNVFSTGILVGSEEESDKLRQLLRASLESASSTDGNLAETPQSGRSSMTTAPGKSRSSAANVAQVLNGLQNESYEIGTSESDPEGDTITDNIDALRCFRAKSPPRAKKTVLAENVYRELPDDKEPFEDWISPGYDVYVVALQEVVSDRLFEAVLMYLNRVNGRPFHKIHFTEDKISGLGDGAYLSMKSTAIACFVAEEILGPSKPINIGSSKGMSLSSLNGSKGAVSIILTIYNQVVCFVSCHLPAGKPDARIRARDFIRRRLAEAYCGFSGVNPTDVFHHIVWAGDFNLRLQELSASVVLNHLYQGNIKSILAFDEFQYSEYNKDFRIDNFEEAEIEFYPTYKKIVGRGPVNPLDPQWLHNDYNVNFKVRWYKGGKTKERVPSWTDRIFKWSHTALRSCLLFIPKTYAAANPNFQTFLLASDHNPVACGLALSPLSSQYSLPPVMFHDARVKGTQIQIPASSYSAKPKEAMSTSSGA